MSKFNKLVSIYTGWKNYVFPSPEIEKLAKKRARSCSQCLKAKKMKVEIIKDGSIKEIEDLCCSLCSCPLSTKLRSQKEVCPLKKW